MAGGRRLRKKRFVLRLYSELSRTVDERGDDLPQALRHLMDTTPLLMASMMRRAISLVCLAGDCRIDCGEEFVRKVVVERLSSQMPRVNACEIRSG